MNHWAGFRVFVAGVAVVSSLFASTIEANHSSTNPNVGHDQRLPRAFGPFVLGMPLSNFKQLTTTSPYRCPHCAVNELLIEIDLKEHKTLIEKYKDIPEHTRSVEFSFFRDKLYKIDFFPTIKRIDSLRLSLVAQYGFEPTVEDWESGVSWLIWQKGGTKVAVAYVRTTNPDFGISETAGTVLRMQYIEPSLDNALRSQEKTSPTRNHQKYVRQWTAD